MCRGGLSESRQSPQKLRCTAALARLLLPQRPGHHKFPDADAAECSWRRAVAVGSWSGSVALPFHAQLSCSQLVGEALSDLAVSTLRKRARAEGGSREIQGEIKNNRDRSESVRETGRDRGRKIGKKRKKVGGKINRKRSIRIKERTNARGRNSERELKREKGDEGNAKYSKRERERKSFTQHTHVPLCL